MRLSKAWLVATRDFKVFSKQKNIWYPIVAFPIIISIIFPTVLNFAQTRNTEITVTTLTNLMNSFSFFFIIGAAFIPLSVASYSIVGEKVEKSLEPLLATPLTDGEILLGKAISALLPTLIVMYAASVVFMFGMNHVTFDKLGYYFYPNWTLGVLLLVLLPIAAVLSILFSIIVSSKVTDVRSASSYGLLLFFPFIAIYLASETNLITLDVNNLLIISGILLAVDVALFFVSTATFRREEILTKWK
ncbi:MAG: ABC transporter permease subunit [Nitrososphaerota archaeon]|jgi:ABC-type Na+ efflux pump permease subunit|nr:ABC transporter permease subunit [Nitrososphaerota archaeon]